ncbi:glycosyltransferase [Providencia rettgeri]|uniref:glycosyltransferase n=1 Tax=Providencia TaxID=586 RepID=UPI0018E4B34D|nr:MULTISPECIES: glycosyltransferase [Providencia]EJD6477296.1 glycosyltransferase [Providencia rettgeri]ELR5065663.1 glycosyltransferase [Providencia rettgeri]ELR5166191.1 glycosyltransferase [Providencia rettgeri]MBI6194333.1 glycosyltransferase [Providencia rettgeri]UPQ39338.1 glycosyltransferase [Providencia rettgeri]
MKLSIITVTYKNNADLISTLESISSSIHIDFINEIEIIVVDAAIDPNIPNIISKFDKSKIKFKLISEKDKGIYDGMNKGIHASKGKHIIFMNSGDSFNNFSLNYFLSEERFDEYVYYGNSDFYNNDDLIFHFKSNMNKKRNFLNHNCFSHQAIFYPRKLVKKLNGYRLNFTISADFDLTWRCFIEPNCNFIPLNISIAKCSLGGISCQNGLTSYKDRYASFKSTQNYLYASLIYIYYPVFFIKNKIVMRFEGSSILNLYRKLKSK